MEIALQTSGDYETLLGHARWAEQLGLAALAIPDHYVTSLDEADLAPAFDAFAQLAGLARDTTTIPLCVLVSPITFRHPAVLGKMALTIDAMSGGRFALGVGTGWLEAEHRIFGLDFPETGERFRLMEDALGYLAALFAPDHPGHDGATYRLEAVATAPRPTGALPLVVGGTGPRVTPRLAGTYAAEYNCYPAPPKEFRSRIAVARAAAEATGRDPADLLISSAGAVLAAETAADYTALFEQTAAEAGITTDALEAHYARRQTPRGTYEQVREQLADLEAAGMTRFYLQRSPDFDRDETTRLVDLLRS